MHLNFACIIATIYNYLIFNDRVLNCYLVTQLIKFADQYRKKLKKMLIAPCNLIGCSLRYTNYPYCLNAYTV